MLPVVICEPDGCVRAKWTELLDEVARADYSRLKLELLPSTEYELNRELETENGILLVILAVTSAVAGGVEACIELFRRVMSSNRDSYVILCVHDAQWLEMVLSRCMRPAGVMVIPFRESLMRASLKHVLGDYARLYAQDDGEYMLVHMGKTLQRVAYRDILYLEAQDKLLHICTQRQVVSVRARLSALEETLPEQFIRCHRSYIVNRAYIERLNLTEMTLQLMTQERIPVSRSFKDALRAQLQSEGEKCM